MTNSFSNQTHIIEVYLSSKVIGNAYSTATFFPSCSPGNIFGKLPKLNYTYLNYIHELLPYLELEEYLNPRGKERIDAFIDHCSRERSHTIRNSDRNRTI